ncbi:MAG TPA: DUF503 domain-containing protein [Planctomycetota bacterium]|mgnify:CR=1 FL=1|jgi:uncharacterized protein YlxP (DUF503 family)|nr:DUF503 domain-containing protein [Planctomycetota bacterium]
MYVGVLQIEFKLHGPTNLKERRAIVRSLKDRIRSTFQVAVAEVGPVEEYREATLGIALVSNEARHARQVADRIVQYIENDRTGAVEITDIQVEIL